jgi:hypothetical protein
MKTSTDVPVTITPEAQARTAELGLQKEAEQMIAYLIKAVPGLEAIKVTIAECYDTRDETGISITAYSDQVFEPGETTSWDSSTWAVATFPPQVLEHLCILFSPGKLDAR